MPKLELKDYSKKAGISMTILCKRIKRGIIKATLGISKRGKPCYLVNTDFYPPKKNGRKKPGRRKK